MRFLRVRVNDEQGKEGRRKKEIAGRKQELGIMSD